MWQKFKEQIPAVILTALLVIGGAWGCIRLVVNSFFPGMLRPLSFGGAQDDGSSDSHNEQR